MGEGYEERLSKEDIYVAKKHMKESSLLLILREMQIKTTVRYHLTPVRKAVIKSEKTTDTSKGVKKREHLYMRGGNVNWSSQCGKCFGDVSKNLK